MAEKINSFDRIRGAADIPMTPAGHAQAYQLGRNFRQNGPLDLVATADLSRTRDTAHAVANGAPVLETHHLRDMDYGIFTGMKSKDAIPVIHKAIETDPDKALPGSSESFGQYQDRIVNMFKLAMQASKQFPDARIGLVVNRRSIKVAQGWLDNGKTDNVFNQKMILGDNGKLEPSDVFKITGSKEGEYDVKKVDSTKPMDPGVYLIRHGLTAYNGESYKPEASNG